MADLEAIILYRPSGFEGTGEFRLARTSEAHALLAVAESAVAEARTAAGLYTGLDESLARAGHAEADRLETVLRQLIPDFGKRPHPPRPRPVPPLKSEADR